MSRCPAAFRLPAFASRSSHSRRGTQPSSRSAYRPTAGPRRGYRVPHARVATGLGALCSPRTTVLIPAGARPQPASAAFSTASPRTPPRQPIMRRLCITRHQREFKRFTRPVFPSPVTPGWNGSASAFPRASHPADQPSDARRGGDRPPSTDLEQHSRHIRRTSNLVFTHIVRPRVAPRGAGVARSSGKDLHGCECGTPRERA